MSDAKKAPTRNCTRCGAEYVDDRNTFCIECEVETIGGPLDLARGSIHPDAGRRLRELRTWQQAKVVAEIEGKPLPPMPHWLDSDDRFMRVDVKIEGGGVGCLGERTGVSHATATCDKLSSCPARCPKCDRPLEIVPQMFFWRGRFFSGLVCRTCNSLHDNPADSFMAHVCGPDEPKQVPVVSIHELDGAWVHGVRREGVWHVVMGLGTLPPSHAFSTSLLNAMRTALTDFQLKPR